MKVPAQCAGLNKLNSALNMPKIPNHGQVLVAIKKQDIFIFLIFCKISIFFIVALYIILIIDQILQYEYVSFYC